MFKLDLSPTFEAPVRFELLSATGAQRQVVEFTAVFPRLTVDELTQLAHDVDKQLLDDRAIAARLLMAWGPDLQDAHGNVLAHTPDNKAAVLNVAGCATAVVLAFRAAQPRAAAGN